VLKNTEKPGRFVENWLAPGWYQESGAIAINDILSEKYGETKPSYGELTAPSRYQKSSASPA
jgi:hypothetical protein